MRDVIREILKDDFDDAEYKGKREGWKKGYDEGVNEINERLATDMLRNSEPLDKILRYSRLSEPAIRSLAASLGVQIIC